MFSCRNDGTNQHVLEILMMMMSMQDNELRYDVKQTRYIETFELNLTDDDNVNAVVVMM